MADINDIKAGGNDVCDQARLLEVGPGVWVRQAIDNLGWIDLGGELVVVDTLEQPELADEVFELIGRSTGGLPVRRVVNTHSHIDHVALNDAFVRRWGCELLSFRGGAIPAGGVLRLAGGRRDVQIVHLPGCHTPEDCVVWVADAGVLFVGDLFGWGLVPYNGNLRPGQSALIRATYRRLIDFQAQVVVPGHGPVCTTGELRRWLDYFDWLGQRLQELQANRLTLAEAIHRLPPPADMAAWWRFAAWKHQDSVKKVFKAVRQGWL